MIGDFTQEIIGRYVEVRGVRAYYETMGSGRPFVCVHSAGTDSRLYRHTLPWMAQQGYCAMAVDLPGHGKSFPLDWQQPIDRLRDFAEWVMDFCEVVGAEQPIILGCSIGADIAVDLAASRSSDIGAAICLEGAAYTPTFTGAGTLMEPHTISWESIAEAMAPTVIRPDATPEQLAEIVWLHKSTTQRVYASDLVGWEHHDVREQLHRVTVPLFVGLGTGDYFLPEDIVKATTDAVPGAVLHRFENLGHYPMWEDPETVNPVILGFLKDHGLGPDKT